MRPYMTGGAYVNYCDTDLAQSTFPQAYWGANLMRLKQVKQAVDPTNVFRHGQSVPLI
jgi:FAD/FMN-containing dehydrogenase